MKKKKNTQVYYLNITCLSNYYVDFNHHSFVNLLSQTISIKFII